MNALGPRLELKGGGWREKNTTFPFLPFRLLLICFFCLLESAISLKSRSRATYEVQPRIFPWLVEHGDARATISKLICWQVLYLKLFCIITFKHGDCFSVIASVCSVSIIACVASCVWGTFDTAPAATIPERPMRAGLTCYWAPRQKKKTRGPRYSHSLCIVYSMCPAAFVRLRMTSSLYFPMQNPRNGVLNWW